MRTDRRHWRLSNGSKRSGKDKQEVWRWKIQRVTLSLMKEIFPKRINKGDDGINGRRLLYVRSQCLSRTCGVHQRRRSAFSFPFCWTVQRSASANYLDTSSFHRHSLALFLMRFRAVVKNVFAMRSHWHHVRLFWSIVWRWDKCVISFRITLTAIRFNWIRSEWSTFSNYHRKINRRLRRLPVKPKRTRDFRRQICLFSTTNGFDEHP